MPAEVDRHHRVTERDERSPPRRPRGGRSRRGRGRGGTAARSRLPASRRRRRAPPRPRPRSAPSASPDGSRTGPAEHSDCRCPAQASAPAGRRRRAHAVSPCPQPGPLGTGPLVHDQPVDAQPLRVIIAEDSALIREGLARLIVDSGGVVVAKVGDGPALRRGGRGAPARRLRRRRADAADPARRGPPRGDRGAPPDPGHAGPRAQPVRGAAVRDRAARRPGRRGRLPSEGPRRGHPRVHGGPASGRPRRDRARSGGRRPADGPAPLGRPDERR